MKRKKTMTKDEIYNAAVQYVEKNHSTADNDFQNAMNVAVVKAFIAGAKCVIEENICLNCKASKDCNKSIKDQCINFLLTNEPHPHEGGELFATSVKL